MRCVVSPSIAPDIPSPPSGALIPHRRKTYMANPPRTEQRTFAESPPFMPWHFSSISSRSNIKAKVSGMRSFRVGWRAEQQQFIGGSHTFRVYKRGLTPAHAAIHPRLLWTGQVPKGDEWGRLYKVPGFSLGLSFMSSRHGQGLQGKLFFR